MSEFASKTLHCIEGTSDKVYQIVLESNPNGTFNVLARWGRRGSTLQEQVKKKGVSVPSAMLTMENLLSAKRKKGYTEIDLTKDIGKAAKVQPKAFATPMILPKKAAPFIPAPPAPKKDDDFFVPVGNTNRRIKE